MEGHKRTMKAQGEGSRVRGHSSSSILEVQSSREDRLRGRQDARGRSDDIAREERTDGQREITREKCPSRRLRSSASKARAAR